MLLIIKTIHGYFFFEMLKKLIKESFFNPVLHIFPVLLFLFLYDVFHQGIAWIVTLPVSLLILVYVYVAYQSLYRWYLISMFVFLVVGFTLTLVSVKMNLFPYNRILGQVAVTFILLLFIVLRKPIETVVKSITPSKVSMQNNLDELLRLLYLVVLVKAGYSVAYIVTVIVDPQNTQQLLDFYFRLYLILLLVVIAYEFIRVATIRARLMREDWLPIVNEKGREIGSINYQISMWNATDKFRHPIVRIMLVEGNRLFLRQHHARAGDDALKWDSAISTHMRFGETIADCTKRISLELYNLTQLKPVFLGNYQMENVCELQYVHLFVTCVSENAVRPNLKHMDHYKWWTINQINDNINDGIFTANFLCEYEILVRSGLVVSGRCQCDCKLREQLDNKKV